jgi:prophage maintenance system killer protein
MTDQFILYTNPSGIEISINLDNDTIWMTQKQIALLFGTEVPAINKHLKNIYNTEELQPEATISKMETVQSEGKRYVRRQTEVYNLDVVLSIGYRVNSTKATNFRIWATQRLREYLVQGYAINEKRLIQQQQEVEYLKTGIRILNRAIEKQVLDEDSQMLRVFAKGLSLLDDYDHQKLEAKGNTVRNATYPTFEHYMELIKTMYSEFSSDVFALPKDDSFHSSIHQIAQSYAGVELYPSIEEKGANLLYFITKNHSFVDGNKRIAAACFLHFMEINNALYFPDGTPIISNEALAALTLFIATSKTEEADIVKQLTISILNKH